MYVVHTVRGSGPSRNFDLSIPFPSFRLAFFLWSTPSRSCVLSSTRPKPAAAPLPSTQKRTRKKIKLEARCNAEQSIVTLSRDKNHCRKEYKARASHTLSLHSIIVDGRSRGIIRSDPIPKPGGSSTLPSKKREML